MRIFRIIFIFPLLYLSQLLGEEEIKIGTLHGQLRFDPEIIVVERSAEIKLIFENQDEMIHNLLIAKGDSKHIDRLAEKALALGEKGLDMGLHPQRRFYHCKHRFGTTRQECQDYLQRSGGKWRLSLCMHISGTLTNHAGDYESSG